MPVRHRQGQNLVGMVTRGGRLVVAYADGAIFERVRDEFEGTEEWVEIEPPRPTPKSVRVHP